MSQQKTKIIVIGGGNGSAVTINALKEHTDVFDFSAVIAVSDSGGSSGKLREEFGTLPPGDLLRAILAMSKYDYKLLKNIFYKNRFSGLGALDKHNIGNLLLVLMGQYGGSLVNAIRALEQSVEAMGRVYPVSLGQTHLCAELTNGEIVKTEGTLDKPTYDRKWKIKKVWLEPSVPIYEDAKRVIEEANYILLSPGSLYTSVIAGLLTTGMSEAITRSQAKLVYIAGDTYEIEGETGPERLSDFIKQLELYLPRSLDMVIYNNCELDEVQTKKYEEKKWRVFEKDLENVPAGRNVIGVDYETAEGSLSPTKLGKVLRELIVEKSLTGSRG